MTLLMVRQILLFSTIKIIKRTVWRIWILSIWGCLRLMAKNKDLVGYHSHDSHTVILTVDNISISLLFHHIEVLYSSIFSKILFELIPVNPFFSWSLKKLNFWLRIQMQHWACLRKFQRTWVKWILHKIISIKQSALLI